MSTSLSRAFAPTSSAALYALFFLFSTDDLCKLKPISIYALQHFQASSVQKASIACRLICRLLALTDAAEKLTPEAIPAAAAALKGKERDASESQDCGILEGKSREVGSFVYKNSCWGLTCLCFSRQPQAWQPSHFQAPVLSPAGTSWRFCRQRRFSLLGDPTRPLPLAALRVAWSAC